MAEMMWQIQPSVPPVPSQNPGVKISQRMPVTIRPLYN